MADARYEAALTRIGDLRTACTTAVADATVFRDQVVARTALLRGCLDRVQGIRTQIQDNAAGLRRDLAACQAALQAAQAGIGTLDPADVARRIEDILGDATFTLDGLTAAADNLGNEVQRACDEVDGLEADNPAGPAAAAAGAAGGAGGGWARGPGGGWVATGGRRQRGGWTPQPPSCRRCCGKGTKRNKKNGKCETKRKKAKKSKRRRRRRR